MERPVVAAFDLDHTLTTRDCVVPFAVTMAGRRKLAAAMTARAARFAPAAARRDRDRLKAVLTDVAFRDRHRDEVTASAERFGTRVVERWMRASAVERLRLHRERGHTVVIVSASYEPYVSVIGHRLGVDAVLATRLEYVDDVATGRLDGPNCRGDEKVRRLHEWLGRWHGDRAAVEVWAYGDSTGDDALLADADHGVRVTRTVPSRPSPDAS